MPEVLIVDDDPDVRAMLSFTLTGHGFRVREAAHGGTALEELERREPDAMLLDLMMPILDGYDVLAAMRERGLASHTRVVILTCKVDERDLVRGWELGADEYLTKPVDPDHLAAKLHEVVGAGTHPRPER